jgi:hypothetical protein
VTPDRDDRPGIRINRRRALAIGGAAAATLLARGVPDVVGSTRDGNADDTVDDTSSISRVHEAGITGDVRVAVLDPTGFDPNHAAIGGSIADIRQFGSESAVVDGTSHGTAAATSVVDIAPDARLSLASFQRADEFVAAIDWARRRAVDVVLAPVAAHGTAGTRRSPVYRAARRAVESGCVFVAPTGNAALGHWEGPYAALAGDGTGERRRLRIRALPGAGSVAGRFAAWLLVDPALELDLTLALLRAVDGGDRWNLVALSQSVASRDGQRLVADLSDGTYALVVRPAGRGGQAVETAEDGRTVTDRVEVTTTTHALASPRPLGSIAVPASVPGVVGVGVAAETGNDAETGNGDGGNDDSDGTGGIDSRDSGSNETRQTDGVAAYSGRGPTPRGDIGVDIVARPDPWIGGGDPGTSAAAARAAGAAALVLDADPNLDPADVAGVLRDSAGEIGRPGRDLAAGSGCLDVVAAVQRARAR